MTRPREQLYAGLDVGTTSVTTVVARVASNGMEVLALGHTPSQGMRKGLVVDAAALTAAVRRSASEAASALGRRLPSTHVGVAGVADAKAASGDRDAAAEITSAVRNAGVRVRRTVPQHLASASAVLSANERELGVVLLDVGGGTTGIAVFESGAVRHASAIPVGGQQFTSDLAVGLGIPPEVAERVKLALGSAEPDGAEARLEVAGIHEGGSQLVSRRRASELLRERSEELMRLVLGRVREAGLDRMPPGGLVLTGGGAKLPAFADAAARYGQCPVRVAAPASSLTLPAEMQDPSFSTAVGLVLWAVQYPARTAPAPFGGWVRRLIGGLHLHKPQGAPA